MRVLQLQPQSGRSLNCPYRRHIHKYQRIVCLDFALDIRLETFLSSTCRAVEIITRAPDVVLPSYKVRFNLRNKFKLKKTCKCILKNNIDHRLPKRKAIFVLMICVFETIVSTKKFFSPLNPISFLT